MNNKTTAALTATLLTVLFASQSAIAGQALTDEYSAANVYTSTEMQERVNFSMDVSPIGAELEAELFPEYEQ